MQKDIKEEITATVTINFDGKDFVWHARLSNPEKITYPREEWDSIFLKDIHRCVDGIWKDYKGFKDYKWIR